MMSPNGALCGTIDGGEDEGGSVGEIGLVASQFGEGGVHLVGQGLVPILVEPELVYTQQQHNVNITTQQQHVYVRTTTGMPRVRRDRDRERQREREGETERNKTENRGGKKK